MTNFETMKPFLPNVGINVAAKVLAEGPGRCNFCADGKHAERFKCGAKCEDGIREWLLKEADENMLPEICSCGYFFEADETICPNCGKKVEEDG